MSTAPQPVFIDGEPKAAPKGRRGKYDWQAIVALLKSRPGEWLQIDDAASIGLPTAIRNQRMVALRDPEWTFKVRSTDNDRANSTCKVFMSAEKKGSS